MTTTLIETPRDFTFVKNGNAVVVPVRHLTIKQISRIGDIIHDKIRDERRKEFIRVSQDLDPKERNRFLIDAARANLDVSTEEAEALADTDFGVLITLNLATDLTVAELTELTQTPENIDEMDYARYYALGLDIDSLRAAIEAGVQEGGAGTAATFPEAPEG